MASPRFEFLSVKSISLGEPESPECCICNEKYDDSDDDNMVARFLTCGHSMCSSKGVLDL